MLSLIGFILCQYRQMAPEVFSDERLRSLIKTKNNNREAILSAIENIWHGKWMTSFHFLFYCYIKFGNYADTPDQQAVGSEWVTTSKTVKKVCKYSP